MKIQETWHREFFVLLPILILILIFMSVVTWGMLEKSQIDPQKIEERIIELIAEHNDNEEAHIGAGRSLDQHKLSEVIDHVAKSIIADKIKDWEVVKLGGDFLREDYRWITIFESIDGYVSEGFEGKGSAFLDPTGCVKIQTGAYLNSFWKLIKDCYYGPVEFTFAKNRRLRFAAELSSVSNVEYLFLLGNEDENNIGFRVANNELYGSVCNVDTGESSVLLQTVSEGVKYDLMADYTSGVKCEFYVNGIKRGELTTNLPVSADSSTRLFWIQVSTTDSSNKYVRLSFWEIWQGT